MKKLNKISLLKDFGRKKNYKMLNEIFFSSKGRMNRQIYLFSTTILNVIGLCLTLLLSQPLYFIISFIIVYPLFCIISKRFHDLDKNNQWSYSYMFIFLTSLLVPIASILLIPMNIYLLFFRGIKNKNIYGENPLKENKYKGTTTILIIPFIVSLILLGIYEFINSLDL